MPGFDLPCSGQISRFPQSRNERLAVRRHSSSCRSAEPCLLCEPKLTPLLRREPVSTSLENALSAHEAAVRLAALYHLAAIRVERIVDDPLRRILCVVVLEAEMPEAFCDSFEPWTLRLVVQRIVGIGAVDDPPKQHQRGILC